MRELILDGQNEANPVNRFVAIYIIVDTVSVVTNQARPFPDSLCKSAPAKTPGIRPKQLIAAGPLRGYLPPLRGAGEYDVLREDNPLGHFGGGGCSVNMKFSMIRAFHGDNATHWSGQLIVLNKPSRRGLFIVLSCIMHFLSQSYRSFHRQPGLSLLRRWFVSVHCAG